MLYVDGGVSLNQKAGYLKMNGKEVFKHAITKLVKIVKDDFTKLLLKMKKIGIKLDGKEIRSNVPEVLQKSEDPVEPFWFSPRRAKRKLRNKTGSPVIWIIWKDIGTQRHVSTPMFLSMKSINS